MIAQFLSFNLLATSNYVHYNNTTYQEIYTVATKYQLFICLHRKYKDSFSQTTADCLVPYRLFPSITG